MHNDYTDDDHNDDNVALWKMATKQDLESMFDIKYLFWFFFFFKCGCL